MTLAWWWVARNAPDDVSTSRAAWKAGRSHHPAAIPSKDFDASDDWARAPSCCSHCSRAAAVDLAIVWRASAAPGTADTASGSSSKIGMITDAPPKPARGGEGGRRGARGGAWRRQRSGLEAGVEVEAAAEQEAAARAVGNMAAAFCLPPRGPRATRDEGGREARRERPRPRFLAFVCCLCLLLGGAGLQKCR